MTASRTPRRALIALALGIAFAAAAPAGATASTACQATLTVGFTPGLSGTTSRQVATTITGTLNPCATTGPATAQMSSGNVWTDPATGFQWQEPRGSVNGTCISNASSAVVVHRWSDGSVSLTQFSGNSATYGITQVGTNLPSVALAAVNRQAEQPETFTLQATRDIGATMSAAMAAVDAGDPAGSIQDAFSACSGTGLTSVVLTGTHTFTG